MIRVASMLVLLVAALPSAGAAQAEPPRPAPDTARAAPRSPLLPDTALTPPGGPRVILLAAPGEGVAALRLAVPLREGPREAGAGMVLRDIALERMETLARPVGARVSASRTPWGIAYAVEGAAADFEYLAWLLREGVSEPPTEGPSVRAARERLREAAARARETPGGRVSAGLRALVAPDVPPPWGVPGAPEPPTPERVREVWLRSHASAAMTLVVSAPVVPEVVLAATRGLGAPADAAAGPLDAPAPPEGAPPPVDALRRWYGQAWHGAGPGDPEAPVAALLVAEHLRRRASGAGYEIEVELWELPDRWGLAVVGSAPEGRARAMRDAVGRALEGTARELEPAAVQRAVARLRGEILLGGRTASGLVALVGRAMEASGEPASAALQLQALEQVDAAGVLRFLDELSERGAVRMEVGR